MENTLGFETIFDTAISEAVLFQNQSEEIYCPDCYDCDYNCTDAN